MMEDQQQLPNIIKKESSTRLAKTKPSPSSLYLDVVGDRSCVAMSSSDLAMSSSLSSPSPLSETVGVRAKRGADDEDDDTDNNEKCDVDPENSKKSCSDVTPDTADDISFIDNQDAEEPSNKSDKIHCDSVGAATAASDCVVNTDMRCATLDDGTQATTPADESSKAAFAFTIDFNDGKQIDSKKKNDIFERFQRRHKRGVSMSKLDERSTMSNHSKPPLKRTVSKPLTTVETIVADVATTVTLRDTSRLCPRDKANGDHRHSWSPRTSMHAVETVASDVIVTVTNSHPTTASPKHNNKNIIASQAQQEHVNGDNDDAAEMILGTVPPLEYRKQSFDSTSSVSEAGTYTLDGDNYTEEQKALMSIDKLSKLSKAAAVSTATALVEVVDLNAEPDTMVLLQSFDRPKAKKHTSYLERIKSKVKTISERTFHKNRSPDKCQDVAPDALMHPPKTLDLGNFTSVTSSGVFSKKPVPLQPAKITVRRKNSLTKSQIDSSEYIQKFDEKLLNSFTDYEKAQHNDYQLNIFCASDSTRHRRPVDTAESQLSSCSTSTTTASYGIEMAETKNDWIQEWAKNARKNTRKPNSARASSERPSHRNSGGGDYAHQLQRNQCGGEEFGDNLDRNYSQRKNIHRYDDTGNVTTLAEPLFLRYEHRPQSASTFGRHRHVADLVSSSDFGDDLDDDVSLASSAVLQHDTTAAYESSNRLRREFFARPPLSPTKIPSPMHSMTRPRSSSVNRSLHSSATDLDKHDTEMYLQKTAAAITSLQNLHRNNNSPQSPSSPVRPTKIASNFQSSPSIRRQYKNTSTTTTKPPFIYQHNAANNNNTTSTTTTDHLYSSSASLHKRNMSLDGTEIKPKINGKDNMFHSYNSDGLNVMLNIHYNHNRHNSYEDKSKVTNHQRSIDQTFAPQIVQRSNISSVSPSSIKQPAPQSRGGPDAKATTITTTTTPTQIKRSSSFSTKPFVRPASAGLSGAKSNLTPKLSQRTMAPSTLQKSASSVSFKNMSSVRYENEIYLNDTDDLYADDCSSDSEFSDGSAMRDDDGCTKELITNTRYNKAFLKRLEQTKQKTATTTTTTNAAAAPTVVQKHQGVCACPNTPEMPKRDMRVRQSLRDRQSMPRDSSISRMKQDLIGLSATKKSLTSAVAPPSPAASVASKERSTAVGGKVLPKYLDISKYKPQQGNTFLKRDESKSTLINKEIRRSSSAFGVGLNKTDAGRSSVRSVKSASGVKVVSAAVTNAANREAELAMWRRRASYDPMKAAAEGKKRQEARKVPQASKYNAADSSTVVVLRSQSFHSGVGQSSTFSSSDSMDAIKNRWSLISTESSDDEFIENR